MYNTASLKERMLIQRAIENKIKEEFDNKRLKGTIHLSTGQEAIDVGITAAFPDGMFFGNHRSHGQYLGATGDIEGLFRQIKQNKTQHLYYEDKFLSTGIQGGLLPVAFGNALGLSLSRSERPVVIFIGDGTFGQGILYETLGLIQLYRPNIHIVIIRNNYAMSKIEIMPNIENIGTAFNIHTLNFYYSKSPDHYKDAVNYSRTGPKIFICSCCRLCGHSCNDTQVYRPKRELLEDYTKQYDPIEDFTNYDYIKKEIDNIYDHI